MIRKAALILSLLLAGTAVHAATIITGTVTNGTSNTPAANADVILLKLEGGMAEEARTKTDAQGHYKITAENGGAPHVLRVMHQNVSYNEPLPPGTEKKDVSVFDAAKKVDAITTSVDAMWIKAEPGSRQAQIAEMFVLKNASTPPRTQMSDKTFEFTLPAGAVIEFSEAKSPGGVPIKTAAVPQNEAGHYAFIFPLRPGETTFQVGYHLPYTGELKLDPKASYPTDHIAIGLPKSMQFSATNSGSAFQLMREENGTEMYVATSVKPGQPLGFKVSGTGTFPREQETPESGDSNTADARRADNRPGGGLGTPEETPDALHQYRWVLIGGLLLILLGGAAWTVTRTGPPVAEAAAAVPASRAALVLDALKEELFQLESERIQAKISPEEYEKAKSALDSALQRAIRKQS
ncbi:MAG: carboxypeptidase-like regulatory domain-containing protein [Terriglobales bacterium]